MECVPTASESVVSTAVPPLTLPVPSAVMPSWKVTDPVASAGTVAVKARFAPKVDGFNEETRTTFDDAIPTTWETGVETEAL